MIHRIEAWHDGSGKVIHEIVPHESEEVPADFQRLFIMLDLTANTPKGPVLVRREQHFLACATVAEAFAIHDATANETLPQMVKRAQQEAMKSKIIVPDGYIKNSNNGHEPNRLRLSE